MSGQARPPIPTINPAVLERWNEIPPETPLRLEMPRGDWDNFLAAMLDMAEATSSNVMFAGSVAAGAPDWPAFNATQQRAAGAQQRIARFVETMMLRAKP